MEEKSTTTSRSIAVIIIIFTLIAVSALIPAKWLGAAPQQQSSPKLDLSAISLPQEVAVDSNNDGVITWKEVMNSTLPTSPATLEELKKIPVNPKDINELNDPNNLTSSFTKNLYLTAAYLDKNGITDQSSKDDMVTKLLQNEKDKIVPTIYTYKDITVAKTESKESVHLYGNTVALILENIITEKSLTDDMTSIKTFIQSKEESDLSPLVKSKKRLDSVIQKLLSVSVPPSAVIFHIMALNAVTAYRDTVANLANANNDPLRATLAVDTYPDKAISTLRLINQFTSYFTTKNIIFSSKEPGYIFTTGYTGLK